MDVFSEFLAGLSDTQQRARMEEVLGWVAEKYPVLVPRIAWNQPMFTDHGTFIIGFSVSKKHMAVAPERAVINHFSDEIMQAGYDHTNELMRILWNSPVNYSLLAKIIDFNILEKADYTTFWRK